LPVIFVLFSFSFQKLFSFSSSFSLLKPIILVLVLVLVTKISLVVMTECGLGACETPNMHGAPASYVDHYWYISECTPKSDNLGFVCFLDTFVMK
jgi:hypothetical protein